MAKPARSSSVVIVELVNEAIRLEAPEPGPFEISTQRFECPASLAVKFASLSVRTVVAMLSIAPEANKGRRKLTPSKLSCPGWMAIS